MNNAPANLSFPECAGCGACMNACPRNAIRFVPDRSGFPFPKVNPDLCVRCGRCFSVCPIRHPAESRTTPSLFAAQRKDADGLLGSSSGGVASLLAERAVDVGGIAFGASFDSDFRVRHIAAESVESAMAFRKSKYVQSEIDDCYRRIEAILETGRQTLFFGTPCQAAGLLAVLGCRPENLLTVDFFCHGVPSPLVFSKYVLYLENQLDGPLLSLDFRDKTNGWGVWFSAKSANRSIFRRADEDPYMVWFLSHHSIRESCLNCPFRGKRHVSDITVGDYWNYPGKNRTMKAGHGVSKILANTDRGLRAIRNIQSELSIEERTFSEKEIGSPLPLPVPFSRKSFLRAVGNSDILQLAARFPTRFDRWQTEFRSFRRKTAGWVRTHLFRFRPKRRRNELA